MTLPGSPHDPLSTAPRSAAGSPGPSAAGLPSAGAPGPAPAGPAPSGPAPAPPAKPARGRGRAAGQTVSALLLVFVTVVLVLFVVFNTSEVDISLVFGNVRAPLVVALLIAAGLGALVAVLAGLVLRARSGRKR